MQTDRHKSICSLIDQSLAGNISGQDEKSLRLHLLTCSTCRQYLDASNRAIAGLGEFSFETDPNLPDKIVAALTIRVAQLETHRLSHRKLALSYVAALVLTLAGSLAAMHLTDGFASAFSLSPQQVQVGLIAIWIVPSLCFCLLLPTLPLVSKRWLHAKGISL